MAIGVLREEKRSSSLMGTHNWLLGGRRGPIPSGLVRKGVLMTLPSLGEKAASGKNQSTTLGFAWGQIIS